MGISKLTGITQEELQELREEYDPSENDGIPFEERYCLSPIPNQPPDYEGPVRFCTLRRDLGRIGDKVRCKYHGGFGEVHDENLDKLAPMKHGMNATREHLVEDFDEKDQALYDWIVSEWPNAYEISIEDDPGALYDLHRLAAEIVRAERGRGFLIDEGEVVEKEVRNEEGRVVIDDNGEVVTEKSEHYLAQMMHRQDKKITQLEKELGISRKERLRQDTQDNAVEAMKSFADLGSAFINRDDKEYDPGDEPWADDNGKDS